MNPVAVNAVDVFTENKRNVTYLESDAFGRVALIAGAGPLFLFLPAIFFFSLEHFVTLRE